MVDVEKATIKGGIPAALISHAYVAIGFRPKFGFDKKKLKAALKGVAGVQYVCCVNKDWADFYMDVAKLDVELLTATAMNSKCSKARTLTHETVVLNIKAKVGDVKGFVHGLLTTMKVLLVVNSGDKIMVKAIRTLKDERFRRLAKNSGVKLGKIERKW